MRADLTDIRDIFAMAISAIDYTQRVGLLPNCNTCKKIECEYRPGIGEQVRINCPLYEGDQ